MISSIGSSSTLKSWTSQLERIARHASVTLSRGTLSRTEVGPFDDLACFKRTARRSLEGESQQFVAAKILDDFCESTIEEELPVVDDNDAFAQLFDVLHVVAGQDR